MRVWPSQDGLVTGNEKVQREGRCRMCQRLARVRPLTRHHLVPQSWFMRLGNERFRHQRNVGPNVIPLCRPCHDLIDNRNRRESREPRRELRQLLTQAECAFVIQMLGLQWLDSWYPRGLEKRESQETLPDGRQRCWRVSPHDSTWPDASGRRCARDAAHDGPCTVDLESGFRLKWWPQSPLRPGITMLK